MNQDLIVKNLQQAIKVLRGSETVRVFMPRMDNLDNMFALLTIVNGGQTTYGGLANVIQYIADTLEE